MLFGGEGLTKAGQIVNTVDTIQGAYCEISRGIGVRIGNGEGETTVLCASCGF